MDSNDLDFLFKIMMLMFVFLGLGGDRRLQSC